MMRTKIIRREEDLDQALAVLREDGLAAVPTETVYGLAAPVGPAVRAVYEVKGRPESKPLSVLVGGPEGLGLYGKDVPPAAYALAESFWPGPLTIVVTAGPDIPADVRAGLDTVGLRCPAHPMTLSLVRRLARPLVCPSANPSGCPSPKTAEEVLAYFDGKIGAVVDGGPCGVGRESTIVDLTVTPYRILRQGALPAEDIQRVLAGSLKTVGVTGGTGAGKTTALDSLRDMGALVIDADKVYHELCGSCRPMLEEIAARFPGTVREGVLERKTLGAVVFSDPQALMDLSAITDKYVIGAIDRMLAVHAAAGGRYAAIDAINLIGTSLEGKLTALVGVLAPEETRARRLVAREGVTMDYAMKRIRAQKPDSYYIERCDHIIHNDGSREQFRRVCDQLFHHILED